jgi:hypothetical protein
MRVGLSILFLCVAQANRAADLDLSKLPAPSTRTIDFIKDIQPLFANTCYACHGPEKQKSNYRLDAKPYAFKGGDIGKPILPGDSAHSSLIHYVAGIHPEITMPPKGTPLTVQQVSDLRAWIDQGARWPADADKIKAIDRSDWWSLKSIVRPPVPQVADDQTAHARNPIDNFILARLNAQHLAPSPQADRRTLIRRLTFDLIGLPPSPEEVDAFVNDPDPNAYENLVDRLLASPRYGERWARHWLDAVHYGDTHGYDKDKIRPNAWPYRDYVIRSFNEDKQYTRFVREQLAGDYYYPNSADGIIALGFIAAGPWDFVGQVELREGTLDKAITRNLDRDDMVTVTMNTFVSLTAQCARCHNHKFDPITQEDYYSVQAVFAGVDRGDRAYDTDGAFAWRRSEIIKKLAALQQKKVTLDRAIAAAGGEELAAIEAQLKPQTFEKQRPEFGYHSAISNNQNARKWVQVDLGESTTIDQIVLIGCHDDFNNIGAGFGFPLRYKVEISDDPEFKQGKINIIDRTDADVENPGVRPQTFPAGQKQARYIRVTATKLAPRQNDFIFALAELTAVKPDGTNAAQAKPVTALDSIEAPPRWRKSNLVDGYFYQPPQPKPSAIDPATLAAKREAIIASKVDAATRNHLAQVTQEITQVSAQLSAIGSVYAAVPTKPRPVFLLNRGSEKQPGKEMGPGTISLSYVPELQPRFKPGDEADRRAALANWITEKRNPLTWRSIVNRIWQYHFGRGIVETPNDFGHMGALPTHPEMLDWLATEFRDGGLYIRPQSIKSLHRLIVTSATYRQSSDNNPANAYLDSGNQYLWRMNRARLDAETIRDSVLSLAGKLDLTAGGPGFRDFSFKDDHSPHYAYAEYDPDDATTHRRSVYRLVVRSVPDPFMETLDCADPSQIVARRNETLTPLQALAMLNNPFMVKTAEHFAERLEKSSADLPSQIDAGCRLAYGRPATKLERDTLVEIAARHGLANACRLILNSNEFVFVD